MPLHLRENQYRGVNAHLHSYLQQRDEWGIFHGAHINDLRAMLQELLPFEAGYVVMTEKSLQISRYELVEERHSQRRTTPDVSIYQSAPSTQLPTASSVPASTPTAVLPLTLTMNEPEYYLSVTIYRAQEHALFGSPVTRIELLSPAHKPGGSHHTQYMSKRDETLRSGIKLLEIDYLHQRPSHLSALPDYSDHEADATPYAILVSDPSPSLDAGKTTVYGFRVDEPIPVARIPLAGEDGVTVDFDAVYQDTFRSNTAYGMVIVDYAALPEAFETYDAVDQQRIRERMKLIDNR